MSIYCHIVLPIRYRTFCEIIEFSVSVVFLLYYLLAAVIFYHLQSPEEAFIMRNRLKV